MGCLALILIILLFMLNPILGIFALLLALLISSLK